MSTRIPEASTSRVRDSLRGKTATALALSFEEIAIEAGTSSRARHKCERVPVQLVSAESVVAE